VDPRCDDAGGGDRFAPHSGRELTRRDVIALTTEQQRGRTVGWLLHVV
jgi:hypothetical protein